MDLCLWIYWNDRKMEIVNYLFYILIKTNLLVESERRPLPLKKRGRPRKTIDVEATNAMPPAKLMDKAREF